MNPPIKLKQSYKSSTRIDAKSSSNNVTSFINSFVAHDTSIKFITGLSKEFSGSAQRMFTVTGTYGTGKSTVALYLSYLLSSDPGVRDLASLKLEQAGVNSLEIQNSFGLEKGWKSISHVCGIEPPAQAILSSISKAVNVEIVNIEKLTDSQCLKQIEFVFNSIDLNSDGLLILIDELGKAFDYQSRYNRDIHFFQDLADIIQKLEYPVILIGFLHQGFAEYYNEESIKKREEWKKVQGRYKDFGYNPSVDESIQLIGDSIDIEKKLQKQLVEDSLDSVRLIATHLSDQNATHSSELKARALREALPMEPMVSALLGPIFKSSSFAQNERSLFGFLNSFERYGFREFIEENYSNNESPTKLYDIENLWNCLEDNYQHLLEASSESKKWNEALNSIDRASSLNSKLQLNITKLVALISVFGQKNTGIHAKRALILDYYELAGFERVNVENALHDLIEARILSPRKQNDSVVIFQGGDLDVQELVLKHVKALNKGVNWLKEYDSKKVYLATAHYHKVGVMRWANARLVNDIKDITPEFVSKTPTSAEPFLTFLLAVDRNMFATLQNLLKETPAYQHICIGFIEDYSRLEEYATELIALKKIEEDDEDLVHDPIAQQNIKKRKAILEHKSAVELESSFEKARWEYCSKQVTQESLPSIASYIADLVYCKSPAVLNELVNRAKPSGSANSAIRKLMRYMLENGDQENLGFEDSSFPPEKGIYLSCIKKHGWHCETDEGFVFPNKWSKESIQKHSHMHELWLDGVNFIKSSDEMITMDKLYERWMKPPFGLTSGLCRLYGLALLKSLEGQIAFYDLDSTKQYIFIPELDEELVTKIYKHPVEAGIRYFEISEIQTHLIDTLAVATIGVNKTDENILGIAKHIVKIVHSLKPWVKKTSGESFINENGVNELSLEARAFRNKVISANDPYKLILEDLPKIFSIDVEEKDASEKLSSSLKKAIQELSTQHETLLAGYKQVILSNLSAEFDDNLKARCTLVDKVAKTPLLKEFAARLGKYVSGNYKFEFVISLATGVPEANWTDKHLRNGLDELRNLCIQFLRIESFGAIKSDNDTKVVSFITKEKDGSLRSYEGFTKFDIEQSGEVQSAIDYVKLSIGNMTKDKQLAALTNILSSIMEETEKEQVSG
ncbi:hypothetical protein [Thalassotalea mangrovi]|uniref:ATP-binding protein n=1 Tax=Thalassotalea mangrovi TaxID=2572245 RepID=A0A4U1B702_9GAMM|nr:hypothetical protein [Thalassotalea mangrovi]TKB46338.1 hypothetical protein E8M12_04600 [Thalassotalea mangrovi]